MFSDGYRWVFAYLLPPLIGAGIGYLTNAVAIRMLFRPFTEKRIFGLKIPFTPGIIPKYRNQLADNIGEMVARELLSRQMLEEHLLSEGFKEQARPRLEELTAKWEESKAGELIVFFNKVRRQDRGFAESGCLKILGTALQDGEIGKRRVEDFLTARAESIASNIFVNIYPILLDSVLETLKKPKMRKVLEEKGRTFIEDVQEKLNFFQKFMINAGRYDKTLKNRMPEIIEDLLENLKKFAARPETVESLSQSIKSGLGTYSRLPLSELFRKFDLPAYTDKSDADLLRIIFSFRHVTIKNLFGLDEKKRQQIIQLLMGLGVEQVVANLDSILRMVDIRSLVVNRINTLNIEDVERILLIIIEKHLAWINIFGAFLGALIGGVQILIRIVTT